MKISRDSQTLLAQRPESDREITNKKKPITIKLGKANATIARIPVIPRSAGRSLEVFMGLHSPQMATKAIMGLMRPRNRKWMEFASQSRESSNVSSLKKWLQFDRQKIRELGPTHRPIHHPASQCHLHHPR
jgi:hypothetical protein